jgi:hypothetical protein
MQIGGGLTLDTVCLWSGGIPQKVFLTLKTVFYVYLMRELNSHEAFLSYLQANLHKTTGLCNVISVILTCFHLMIFWEEGRKIPLAAFQKQSGL